VTASSADSTIGGVQAPVLRRREGPVLHLVLNRPATRNALSLAMVASLREAMREAASDGVTRVLVLRGSGGHFCAGADLQDMAAARAALAQDDQALAKTNALFGELCAEVAQSPLATVALLEGSVMGGGFGLACAVDVAVAADNVRFKLPEVTLGIVPAQIAPYLVERLGLSEARRLAISGASLNAQQALALRLVHEVHLAEQLDTGLATLLHQLLQAAPGAVAATKALIASARQVPPYSMVQAAAQAFSAAALGPEGQEGTMAFLQKRKAAWMPA
jgi:isohexenylglutaconyl-CoA hydratase